MRPPIIVCTDAFLATELLSITTEVAGEAKGNVNDLHARLAQTMMEGVTKGVKSLVEPPAGGAAMFMASIYRAMPLARATGNVLLFWQIAKLSRDRLKFQ